MSDVDQWFSNQNDPKDKVYAFLSFVEQSIKDLVQSSYNHSIEENSSDFAKGITGNGKPNVLLMSRCSETPRLKLPTRSPDWMVCTVLRTEPTTGVLCEASQGCKMSASFPGGRLDV
jgi:hypothetical protein